MSSAPSLAKGTRDFTAQEIYNRRYIIGVLQQNFELFGFQPLETPSFENLSTLTGKYGEEGDRLIFKILNSGNFTSDVDEETWQNKDFKKLTPQISDKALRYDLTVPFARFVAMNHGKLSFPFKRYQIQPVWRWERAQKGRFREFFQCDIDAIWKGEKEYFYYDAEIIAVLGKTLTEVLAAVNIQDSVCFHINNKKIIRAFLQEIAWDKAQDLWNLIDKYAKLGQEKFLASLQEDFWFDAEKQQKILKFIQLSSDKIEDLDQLLLFSQNEDFLVWIAELRSVLNLIQDFQKSFWLVFHWVFDMQIIRGLDYYTGTIFEAVFENEPQLGSICWGGRYQNLTGYIDPKRNEYCGVWGSIWISRILSRVFFVQETRKQTVADYLILQFEGGMADSLAVGARFLAEGKCFELYPYAEKLWKQFAYADKKGIPFVVIYGEGEKEKWIYKLKNMQSWEEQEVPLD